MANKGFLHLLQHSEKKTPCFTKISERQRQSLQHKLMTSSYTLLPINGL